jgi:hypothetical protein
MSIVITVSAVCGVALRLYFLMGVGLNHPRSSRHVPPGLPLLLLLDTFWATSPLLLWIRFLGYAGMRRRDGAFAVYAEDADAQRLSRKEIYESQIQNCKNMACCSRRFKRYA